MKKKKMMMIAGQAGIQRILQMKDNIKIRGMSNIFVLQLQFC